MIDQNAIAGENTGYVPGAATCASCPPYLSGTPSAGQAVTPEAVGTGDGTTTVFTTAFPWQPSSIAVRLNGVDVTDAVSLNAGTGTITFATAPGDGSDITASYRVA